MHIKSFTYTKDNKEVSNRVLAVIVEPNTMFEGMDITPLSVEDQALYANAINNAREQYMNALAEINDAFELRNQYRRFNPHKMTNIVDEVI